MGLGMGASAQQPAAPVTPAPIKVEAVTVTPTAPVAAKEMVDAGPQPEVPVAPVTNADQAKAQVPTNPDQVASYIQLIKRSYTNGSYLVLICAVIMLGFGFMNKISWTPTIPSKWMSYVAFASAFAVTFATNILAGEPMMNCLLTAILAGWGTCGAYSVGGKLLVKHPGEPAPAPAAPQA